eukprot:CAMPEP_0204263474 /NCGR_PEP_ID=MMETSP0468-20130131/8379_2 /ASSEMBLY_ACC=CAM_ASM_000383 /TAXON_ID=2969 /ORGANISM="Oxyrrhis marina" /LENGTH=72 /DNA_ID=CAMNT_0051238249 /DNA_START=102 /DNA_END=319 /DNA_ORIENTATION=-
MQMVMAGAGGPSAREAEGARCSAGGASGPPEGRSFTRKKAPSSKGRSRKGAPHEFPGRHADIALVAIVLLQR